MTISSENRKSGPYLGTGAVLEYPFDFTVFRSEDLLVVVADENDAESVLVLNSDYTVTLNGDQDASPGGTVVLTDPLPADHLLVITSDIEALQPTDLTNQGGFYPEVVNASLDRLTILIQQLKEQVARSLKVSITSSAEATPDAIIAEMSAAVVSASSAATAASGSATAAAGSATAASGSASAAATSASAAATSASSAATAAETAVAQLYNSPTLGTYKNKLTNPNFLINQRGVSGTVVLAAGQFGHDRWKAGASGCTYTFSKTQNVTLITISSGSLVQKVSRDEITGGIGIGSTVAYVLNWGGTSAATVAGSSVSKTVSFNVTTGSDIDVEFGVGTLSLPQLEPGTQSSRYEGRSNVLELLICQHDYYRESIAAANKPYSAVCQNLSGAFRALFRCPVKMRSAPTVFEVSGTPGDFQLVHGATAVALTNALNLSQATESAVLLDATLAGLTDGRAGYLRNTSANPTYIAWGTGF